MIVTARQARYYDVVAGRLRALVFREPHPLAIRLEHDLFWAKFGAAS